MNEPREHQKVEPPSPSGLEGKSLLWWLKNLSPGQLWKLLSVSIASLVLCFNIGAWFASLNLPYFKDLPWFPDSAKTAQRALRIVGVDLGLDSEGRTEQALRIVAVVNGSVKAYPTDGTWARPNPNLSSEPFTIPEAQEYSIRFEVFPRDARGAITRFVASSAYTVPARQLPATGLRIQLHEEGSRGDVVGAVRFSIE